MTQKSSASIMILLIVVAIVVVGGTWYYKSHQLEPYQPSGVESPTSASQSMNSNIRTSQSSTPPSVEASTTEETSVGSSPASSTESMLGWHLCQNDSVGYYIKYPQDWEVTTYGGGANVPASCSDPQTADDLSFSPINSDTVFQPAINIQDEGTSTSLSQFFQDNSVYAVSNPSSTPITIAGESVPWFDYGRQESTIFVWRDGHMLEISISNMPTSTLTEMLGSFEFML
jgi:cytoskeletal protein RodZ